MFETSKYITAEQLPHRRIEAWKYSNIKPWLESKSYQDASESNLIETLKTSLPSAEINLITDLTVINQLFSFAHQDSVKSFALTGNCKAIEIKIKKNDILKLKLDIDLLEKDAFKNTLLFFSLEECAQLEYVANITAASGSFHTVNHYFHLMSSSRVAFGRVQNQDKQSAHLGYDHALVEKDAHFENCSLNLGAQFSRTNIDVSLASPGAHATLNGVYPLAGEQHSDSHSHIHHHAAHTTSCQLYKGILDDNSRGVFAGRIHVHRDAQLINSEQLNKVLLLSNKAQTHSQPQLEIFANDVKCTHGSTTGQLSPEEIFYLESRGITPEKSAKILARGFGFDVLTKLENKWLYSELSKHLEVIL